jgi:hypothetical protein
MSKVRGVSFPQSLLLTSNPLSDLVSPFWLLFDLLGCSILSITLSSRLLYPSCTSCCPSSRPTSLRHHPLIPFRPVYPYPCFQLKPTSRPIERGQDSLRLKSHQAVVVKIQTDTRIELRRMRSVSQALSHVLLLLALQAETFFLLPCNHDLSPSTSSNALLAYSTPLHLIRLSKGPRLSTRPAPSLRHHPVPLSACFLTDRPSPWTTTASPPSPLRQSPLL